MLEHQEERRRKGRREDDDVDAKLDQVLGLLGGHIATSEAHMFDIEDRIKDLKDEYFGVMEGHEHKYHHEYQAQTLTLKKEAESEWRRLQTNLKEKAIIFVFGAVMSYIGALLWFDIADRINKEPGRAIQNEQKAKP